MKQKKMSKLKALMAKYEMMQAKAAGKNSGSNVEQLKAEVYGGSKATKTAAKKRKQTRYD